MQRKSLILLIILLSIVCIKSDFKDKSQALAGIYSKSAIVSNGTEIDSNESIPAPEPRSTKSLDFSKLYGLNSNRIGWGVQLKGKGKAPDVSHETIKLFKKYDAHYIGDTGKKKLYFVFSASYEGGYTPRILDALKANDAKAVFFLVGEYIKENPELVKRMIHEGHEIGNHSMHHPSLPDVSDDRLKKEMIGLDDYFYTNFGKQMKYFMPPSGEYSEKVLAAAKQMGYTSIFWSFAYLDYDENSQKGAQYAYDKVMSNLHNGAIIFLHTVSKDNAYALDSILKAVKKEGYTIGTMDL